MFTKPELCAAAVIAAGMAIASPPAMAQETSPMVKHHTTAAEHHEQAARHHREAAKHYEARRPEQAAHHAEVAHGHLVQATQNAEEAAKLHMQQHGTARQ